MDPDAPTFRAVVDTCVLLDFYSAHDFLNAADAAVLRATDVATVIDDDTVRQRRRRARDAAHLFLHLNATAAQTYSLTEELLATLPKRVPPDRSTLSTHYTKILVHFVLPRLLPAHHAGAKGPAVPLDVHSNAADTALVDFAAANRLPLITTEWNDKATGILAKARAASVAIYRPADYLDSVGVEVAERDRLARRFVARFDRKATSYLAPRKRNSPHRRAVADVRRYYQLTLFGDTAFGPME